MPPRDKLDTPFERVTVQYATTGGTKVMWQLHRLFTDPQPHSFQLQGAYGGVDGSAWEDIGLPVVNTFFAVDDEQRIYGKNQDWNYRAVLTTPTREYTSQAVTPRENLNFRDWRLSTDLIRKERLRLNDFVGVQGFLLKRKRYGTPCTRCVEKLSGEVTDSDCPVCNGTGILVGYYAAIPDVFIEIPPVDTQEQMDNLQVAGTTERAVVQGCRALGDPGLDVYDVFVVKGSDLRYVVRDSNDMASHRGYTIASTVTMNQLPFTDRAYKIPLEGT